MGNIDLEVITFHVILETMNVNEITQGECIERKVKGVEKDPGNTAIHGTNRGKETSKKELRIHKYFFLPKRKT